MTAAEATYGTTVVRAARPEPQLCEITSFGDPGPVYLEVWRGWVIEEWGWWDLVDWPWP